MGGKILKSIRIVGIPPGFADEAIRKQWIGIVIPLAPDDEAFKAEQLFKPSESSGGYIVRGAEAVEALEEAGREEAASFWSRPSYPAYLRFARDQCELVD